MPINHKEGRSVYCSTPIKDREKSPLYKKVRHLVRGSCPPDGQILDLGCGDMVASRQLIPEYKVIGLDLSPAALGDIRRRGERTSLVNADLTQNLPFAKNLSVEMILMLDVLEHLSKKEAINCLVSLKDLFPQGQMIVSLPIISATIPLARELIRALFQGHRPSMGLLDITHQILTGQTGHRKIFEQGGWQVTDEWVTTPRFGVIRTNSPHPSERILALLTRYQGIYQLK